MRTACILALGLTAACSHDSAATSASDSAASASAPVSATSATAEPSTSIATAEPSSDGPPARPPLPPAPSGEPTRTMLPRLEGDPRLQSQLAKLRSHFDGGATGPFDEQRIELQGGRTAFLVSRPDESQPIVLVLDRTDLLFEKAHPTAGITPPVLHPTIAPGPEGGVVLFTYVASLHLVAARMWADDSNPYAEVEVFQPGACDALTAAYASGAGWIVACTSEGGTRAQRLRENLTSAWDKGGLPVGPRSPIVGRPTIAFDGPSAWTLSERAKAVGGDRQVSAKYDLSGEAL